MPVLDTASDYTVSAWVKPDRADGAFQTVISQDGPADSDFFLQYSGADQRFAMSFVGVRALAPVKPEPGRWYHLDGTVDQVHLYDRALPAAEIKALYDSGT